jgi:glycosyltransferase involved in cell wall biosynthesis
LKSKLRIGINAQIPLGSGSGGIETVVRMLTYLGELDGDEEYVFIGHWADSDWLKPFLNEHLKLIAAPGPSSQKQIISESVRRSLEWLRPLARKIKQRFSSPLPGLMPPVLLKSTGFYESLGCDVIHFPYQDYVLCNVPTVFNPHDLQHLHFPSFFSSEEIVRREIVYPGACQAAHTVVVASHFVKQDIVANYGIDADKIQVVTWSPPDLNLKNTAKQESQVILKRYGISDNPFMLYPAMTWEHKNHIRLLEAIALLRETDNLKINLVCTGYKNDFFPQIEQRLHDLNLESQVKFLGLISREELGDLYLQAQFVIIPTLFEAASGPLFEAWQHGAAAACSTVTSLPEQAAGAALLFNPYSVQDIADAIKKMNSDESLRAALVAKGTDRIKNSSFEDTLKSYRAVYRKTAGLKLNEEDQNLLDREK